jgi:hypothetical protein
MATDGAHISLAGSTLGETRHVCALFHDDDEEYRVLLSFIKDGFDDGDKSIHVVNRTNRATTCSGWRPLASIRRPRRCGPVRTAAEH